MLALQQQADALRSDKVCQAQHYLCNLDLCVINLILELLISTNPCTASLRYTQKVQRHIIDMVSILVLHSVNVFADQSVHLWVFASCK